MEIKGYNVPEGYMGWTGKKYQLFSCESDYREWIGERIDEDERKRHSIEERRQANKSEGYPYSEESWVYLLRNCSDEGYYGEGSY